MALRLPTNVLRLNGTLAHDPGKYADRQYEPKDLAPLDLDTVPVGLTELESIYWHEIGSRCPIGVLTTADREILELVAKLKVDVMTATCINPPVTALYIKALGLLGMTPADRSRVSVAPKSAKPISKFAQRANGTVG